MLYLRFLYLVLLEIEDDVNIHTPITNHLSFLLKQIFELKFKKNPNKTYIKHKKSIDQSYNFIFLPLTKG